MKSKTFFEDDNKLMIRITNSNFETINSIRRSCMNFVPTMAIEDVEIVTNNSALYDEVLASRLGLIPLTTDLKSYTKKNECSCLGIGCAKCVNEFVLTAKGPYLVYSKDLISTDPAIKPVSENFPIVKLFDGQEIKLTAKANLNTGSYHSKHQGAMVYYSFYPIVKDSILKKFPKEIINDNKIIDFTKFETFAEDNDINFTTNDKDVIFIIESWGQLKSKKLFNEGINELKNKLLKLKKLI